MTPTADAADAAFFRAVTEDAAQRAPARRLLDIHAVTVAGIPTPAQAVRIGDTIKVQVDGRAYDMTVTKGLLP